MIMIEATLADLRKSSTFFSQDEIIHIIDGRKKEEIGYFVPSYMKAEFEEFLNKLQLKQKRLLLKRVAQAQKNDTVGDGALSDGIQ